MQDSKDATSAFRIGHCTDLSVGKWINQYDVVLHPYQTILATLTVTSGGLRAMLAAKEFVIHVNKTIDKKKGSIDLEGLRRDQCCK